MDRRKEEGTWHEKLFQARQPETYIIPASIRSRYFKDRKYPLFHLEMMFKLAGSVPGKNVLVYGCGDSNAVTLLALKGAKVWAFDLSHEAVRIQKRMAAANGVADSVHLLVCAAEELPFDSPYFDMVFGCAILHHLPDALPNIPASLHRVLRKGGFAIFTEPVIQSQLIQRLRSLFQARTDLSPGERQLIPDDIKLFRSHFDLETFYFHGISRLDRFLVSAPLEDSPTWHKTMVYGFHAFDHFLFQFRSLRHLAGIVVLKLTPRD